LHTKGLNILCLGDIVGQAGCDILYNQLPVLIDDYNADFVIANIENAASGFGFNQKVYQRLQELNVDAFTTGNHVYAKRDVLDNFESFDCLVRPHNLPHKHPGTGVRIFDAHGYRIAVINLIGRVFMSQLADCPFKTMDALLDGIEADIIIVDFHAETTSEKQALGWYLCDKVSLVYGTHTHVQTNDCRCLSPRTGYLTDLGMCGAYDSVIGMDKDISVRKFITQLPERHRPVKHPRQWVIGGLLLSVDMVQNKIDHIEAFNKVVHNEAN
jgi:metallophosphoesterase (TIGR00282 family)